MATPGQPNSAIMTHSCPNLRASRRSAWHNRPPLGVAFEHGPAHPFRMDMEIVLPDEIATMTLPDIAFFPQALLPLHIFEPRYRLMLRDILASDRLFAVAGVDAHRSDSDFEPPHRVATVGIVRACQETDNGTANLLIQGLARVEILSIVKEEPYRQSRVRALASQAGATPADNLRLRSDIQRLIRLKQRLGATISRDFTGFLQTVEDPETYADLVAFSVCDDPRLKQRLLETLDVHQRLKILGHRLASDVEELRLRRRLQGNLDDDAISNN